MDHLCWGRIAHASSRRSLGCYSVTAVCKGNRAAVFGCGEASRMAPDVRQAVAAVFRDHTGISAANAPCLANGPGSEPALSGGHLGLRCLTRTGLVLQPIGSAIALPAGEMGCMLPGSEAPAF